MHSKTMLGPVVVMLFVIALFVHPSTAASLGPVETGRWKELDAYTGVMSSPQSQWQYIAGFFDGDGSARGDGDVIKVVINAVNKSIQFTQSSKAYLNALLSIMRRNIPGLTAAWHQLPQVGQGGRFSDGSGTWQMTFNGQWAVAVAAALAPFVILKRKAVCKLAGIKAPKMSLGELCRTRLCKPYTGGIFDAEGCVDITHDKRVPSPLTAYSNLRLRISQNFLEFNKVLASYLKRVCCAGFSGIAACVIAAKKATVAFYNTIVVAGYSIRKGFKLHALIEAWFPDGGMTWGSLPSELFTALPSFPTNDKAGCACDPHGYSIRATRYQVYLKHGPVECKEDENGILPVLRGGQCTKIPGLWNGRNATYLAARPEILQLKAAFNQ